MRYLMVEVPRGLQDKTKLKIAFRGATFTELYQRWAHARANASPGCGYLYRYLDDGFGNTPRYELIDTFEEPGRIEKDRYWSYWVPGVEPAPTPTFADDDEAVIRFKLLEMS